MKKILLSLSIVLIVGVTKAQTQIKWWQPSTTQWLTVSDSIFNVGSGISAQYFGPLPVNVVKGSFTTATDTSNAWILKQIVNKSISDTSNAWIQNLIKTNTTNNATTLRQDSTIAYLTSMVQLSAAKYSKTFHDTLSTRIDTVSRRIAGDTTNNLNYIFVNSKAWEADITVNDTVEISSDANFGTGNVTIVYPNTQPGLPIFKRLLFYFPNLYIRRYVTTGGTGTVTIDLRIWAY
jgi:hypothetical protein